MEVKIEVISDDTETEGSSQQRRETATGFLGVI